MTLFSGDATFKVLGGQHYQVDADDIDDAEFQMLGLVKEDFPEGMEFSVNNIAKVNND